MNTPPHHSDTSSPTFGTKKDFVADLTLPIHLCRVEYKVRCAFHLTQDAERAMPAWGLGPSINREAFRQHFRNLRLAPDRESFDFCWKAFEHHFKEFPKAVEWVQTTIDDCGDGFLHHRVPFQALQGLMTDNHVESFNRLIKYSKACLGGSRNRLLARLLDRLLNLCSCLSIRRLHKQDGRVDHSRRQALNAERQERGRNIVRLLAEGYDVLNVYDGDTGLCQVRSAVNKAIYTVSLSQQYCNCQDSRNGFVCKHQWAALDILPGGAKKWGYFGIDDAPLKQILTPQLVRDSTVPTFINLSPYQLPSFSDGQLSKQQCNSDALLSPSLVNAEQPASLVEETIASVLAPEQDANALQRNSTDKSSRSLTNEPERPVSGGPTGLPASVFDADYCDIPDDPSPLSHEVAVGISGATIRGE
jgi:hypothetical protein